MNRSLLFEPPLEAEQIREILPHRYPFLLIDRVLHMEAATFISAIKCVTQNEPHFMGHFPQHPIMPGVLLIETMAQAGAILLLNDPEHHGKLAVLASVQNARFRRSVIPGDCLKVEVRFEGFRMGIGRANGSITVDGERAAESAFKFALIANA